MEAFHVFDDLLDIVVAGGAIYLINIGGVHGVELQDVVVDTHQGVVHLWTVNHCGVAEHADLGIGTVLVAQTDGIVDDLSKVGMAGGLAIAGKGEHVGQLPFGHHLLQLLFQLLCHQLARRTGKGRAVIAIESTLAVDAVEGAYLAVGRLQVDAQRDAESAAMDRPENGRRIDNCTHNECKSTKFVEH